MAKVIEVLVGGLDDEECLELREAIAKVMRDLGHYYGFELTVSETDGRGNRTRVDDLCMEPREPIEEGDDTDLPFLDN